MNSAFKHYGLALLCALALVGIVDALGNEIERPAHDGKFYVDMARNGVVGNPQLAAPFAYRPAVPLLVGALASATGVEVIDVFGAFSRFAALAGLLAAFALARFVSGDLRTSLAIMACTGLSYFHVKFPLFFFPLVDVEAAPLMLLALFAALTRRHALCLATGAVGLFFKEFLLVPLLVMCVMLARDYLGDRSRRDLLVWLAVTVFVSAICLALPRAALPVRASMQFIDPIRAPETLKLLWEAPLNPGRTANLLFAIGAYWLPTAMLFSRERARLVYEGLGDWRLPLAVAFAGVLGLAMYGGTNLNLFLSYTLGVQVIVLATLPKGEVGGVEWIAILIALFVFSRIAFDIPSPIGGPEALHRYVDFYAGWSDRTVTTGWRSLELAAFVALGQCVRLVAKALNSTDRAPRPSRQIESAPPDSSAHQ